nr:2-dehydropantoate 2-reductase N-terminal domain-containing protein [Cohnella kolymensis]
MKILVVGAGAIGGFLAARMLEAGLHVTLLVREARKRQLLETGLVVVSPAGDFNGRPTMLVSGESAEPFDLVIMACKSYALDAVLNDINLTCMSKRYSFPS